MPLQLPAGIMPGPIPFTPDEVLESPRITTYEFDLLDNDEELLGTIDSVLPGGSVDWQASASVKGGGSINVSDIGQDIDWLNARVRPKALIAGASGDSIEVPCGLFIPAAPVEDWTEGGRSWKVELLDKCSLLDQDIVTDANGNPVTYTSVAGANVVNEVKWLIESAGETTPAIEPGTKTLNSAMTWETGTSRLRIINDLLAAAGYFSLWCDGQGQYRVSPYVVPSQRTPVYEARTPFSKGDFSLMSPDWQRDRDIYSIPNRYVAIGQGDGTLEAPVAVATNVDPNSPFSYPSRGRWITHVVTGVEATSQAELTTRAKMGLAQLSSVTSGITASHIFLPDMAVNAVVRFVNPDADLDILCSVSSTSIPFDPVALCKSELQEVVV